MKALFGPAGNPDNFIEAFGNSTVRMPAWLGEIGLDAYEYQCGNGVRIGMATAETIGSAAKQHGITISLHAPYYISLSNPDQLEKNINYVLQSCGAVRHLGGSRIVLHSGTAAGRPRSEALHQSLRALEIILKEMDSAGYGDLTLCPETMGKINQLGDAEEVLILCSIDERLVPCIDFGHLYARTLGELEGYEKTAALFDLVEDALGYSRAALFHSHFSKIEYSKGGEKRHLTFEKSDYGPDFRPIARLAAERGYTPTFICESAGTQSIDALEMKRIYLEELERAADSANGKY